MKKYLSVFFVVLLMGSLGISLTLVPVSVETTAGAKDLAYAIEFFNLWDRVESYDIAKIIRVVDGDTIVASIGGVETTVRLIGIDTPETVHPTKEIENFGIEASNLAKNILEGKDIIISYDWNPLDRYGRTLAYIWIEVDFYGFREYVMYNLLGVLNGYGRAYLAFPFEDYLMELFAVAQDIPRELSLGLWSLPEEEEEEAIYFDGPVQIAYILADSRDEYVMVYNIGDKAVNLNGWQILAVTNGQKYTFEDLILEPGMAVHVHSGPDASVNVWKKSYIWRNRNGEGRLFDSSGNLVSIYSY
jgi:micrococcal nuclease